MAGGRQVEDRESSEAEREIARLAGKLADMRQIEPAISVIACAGEYAAAPGVNQKVALIVRATVAQNARCLSHSREIHRPAIALPDAEDAAHG
jgi:hypothetical protein